MKTLYNEFWKKLEDKPNKSTFNLGEIAQKYLDSINLGNNTSNDLAKYENFKGQWKYIIYLTRFFTSVYEIPIKELD